MKRISFFVSNVFFCDFAIYLLEIMDAFITSVFLNPLNVTDPLMKRVSKNTMLKILDILLYHSLSMYSIHGRHSQ